MRTLYASGRELGLPSSDGFGRADARPPVHARAVGHRSHVERLVGTDPELGEILDLGEVQPWPMSSGAFVLAANGTDHWNFIAPSNAAILVTSMRVLSTGAVTLAFVENESKRPWQGRPILASLWCGDGRFPFVLPVPSLVPPQGSIGLDMADTSGAPNTVTVVLEGGRIPVREGLGRDDFIRLAQSAPETTFVHAVTVALPAAASGTVEGTIQIPTDAEWLVSDFQASDRTNWDAQFSGSNTGLRWFERHLPAETIFGEGQRPGSFAFRRRLAEHEDLILEARNRTAVGRNVTVALIGAKRWPA